jgi:hypothetical protein
MLRTRLRNCQGVVTQREDGDLHLSRQRATGQDLIELARLRTEKQDYPHCPGGPVGFTMRRRNEGSPIFLSTTVPLTHIGPESILHEIGRCPTSRHRRKSTETMGQESVYRFETGS